MKQISIRLIIVLISVFLCGHAFSSKTLAAEDILVNIVSISPEALSEAGEVTVTFEISNHSDYELSDISIVHSSVRYEFAKGMVIPCGGSAKVAVPVEISDNQIGLPVTFMVGWYCDGEPAFKTIDVVVERTADPVISMNRTTSHTHARKNENITVTYTLINNTVFDMTDLVVYDHEINSTPVITIDLLRSYDTKTFEYSFVMGDSDVTSAPEVVYHVNGMQKTFSAISPKKVEVSNTNILLEIDRGTSSESGTPFGISVTNNGNISLSGLVVVDEIGNRMNTSAFSLNPGESEHISISVPPISAIGVRNLCFTVYGYDETGNSVQSQTSDIFTLYPYVDNTNIDVTMKAEIVTEWSQLSGNVTYRITVSNNSNTELYQASISETNTGVLATYPILAKGNTVFTGEMLIGSPRNLDFVLKAEDASGNTKAVASAVLPVGYSAAATSTPEIIDIRAGTNKGAQTEGLSIISTLSNMVFKIIVSLGAMMVIACVILLILSVIERSKAESMGIAFSDEESDFETEAVFQAEQLREDEKDRVKETESDDYNYGGRETLNQNDRYFEKTDKTNGSDRRPKPNSRTSSSLKEDRENALPGVYEDRRAASPKVLHIKPEAPRQPVRTQKPKRIIPTEGDGHHE